MTKRTIPEIPTMEQLEAELERINKKKHKTRHAKSGISVPTVEQVIAERERLQNHADKKAKRIERIEKIPVEFPHSDKKKRISVPAMEEVVAERAHLQYKSRFRRLLANTVGILLVVAAVSALVTMLFLPVLQVSGNSMEPTLEDGNIIVLMKTREYQTKDLVGLYYNGKIMLKRVIGQAGDYVNIDSEGNVYVNGVCVDEPYITGKSLGDCDVSFPLQVPDDSYFVLGDHRSVSLDSRNSVIGCIKTEQMIGKIVVRLWPLRDISLIH